MQIDNDKIYVVDIYKVEKEGEVRITNEKKHVLIKENMVQPNVICVNIGKVYVPVKYIGGELSYLDIAISEQKHRGYLTCPDARLIGGAPNKDGLYAENVRRLLANDGQTKLRDLKAMTFENVEKQEPGI